jgi:hypothetical protein
LRDTEILDQHGDQHYPSPRGLRILLGFVIDLALHLSIPFGVAVTAKSMGVDGVLSFWIDVDHAFDLLRPCCGRAARRVPGDGAVVRPQAGLAVVPGNASCQRGRRSGWDARAASKPVASRTMRWTVAIPIQNPAASRA